MKRLLLIISVLCILFSIHVSADEEIRQPKIVFDNDFDYLKVDGQYVLQLCTSDFNNLNFLKIQIKYNPEVLRCDFASSLPDWYDDEDFVCAMDYSNPGIINLEMSKIEADDLLYYDRIRVVFNFTVMSLGDSEMEVELLECDSKNDVGIVLDTSALNTNIDGSRNIRGADVDGNETYLIGQTHYIDGEWYRIGEVSGDYVLNARDALLILKHSADIEKLSENLELVADVDLDGNVTASDALMILKYSANMFLAEDMNIEMGDCFKFRISADSSGLNYKVISTYEEFKEYSKGFYSDRVMKDVLITHFNEEYFAENSLIAILKEETSGSHKINYWDVVEKNGKYEVKLTRYCPMIGTCDMAYWQFLITVEGKDIDTEDVSVDITNLRTYWQ